MQQSRDWILERTFSCLTLIWLSFEALLSAAASCSDLTLTSSGTKSPDSIF
jgi:hypothetical protein